MKKEVYIAAIGLLLVGTGVLWYFYDHYNPSPVQVISKATPAKEIMVDIQGEIVSPGIYKMNIGDRVQDLLDKAGGLTESADSKWVETNLNRAKKVSDGEKVFIPRVGEQESIRGGGININAATQKELESIAGIGSTTAGKIIAGRPYQELTDLVTRKIITAKLYTQIKDQLSLW